MKIDDQSRNEVRPLEEGELDRLEGAAETAREQLGEDCIAVGLVVVRATPQGVSSAVYVTYPPQYEPQGAHLRDVIAETVSTWDKKQKAARN